LGVFPLGCLFCSRKKSVFGGEICSYTDFAAFFYLFTGAFIVFLIMAKPLVALQIGNETSKLFLDFLYALCYNENRKNCACHKNFRLIWRDGLWEIKF
jgi:hypothetical protein